MLVGGAMYAYSDAFVSVRMYRKEKQKRRLVSVTGYKMSCQEKRGAKVFR